MAGDGPREAAHGTHSIASMLHCQLRYAPVRWLYGMTCVRAGMCRVTWATPSPRRSSMCRSQATASYDSLRISREVHTVSLINLSAHSAPNLPQCICICRHHHRHRHSIACNLFSLSLSRNIARDATSRDATSRAGEEAVWATTDQLGSYAVAVDSGVTGILLPLPLFAAVAALFTQITPSFNEDNPLHGKRNTSLLWPNTGRPESVCGGPVTADYEPAADSGGDFHTISIVLSLDSSSSGGGGGGGGGGGDGGGGNFTIRLVPSDYLKKNPTPDSSRIRLPNGAEFSMALEGDQTFLCNSIGVSPSLNTAGAEEGGGIHSEKIVLGGEYSRSHDDAMPWRACCCALLCFCLYRARGLPWLAVACRVVSCHAVPMMALAVMCSGVPPVTIRCACLW
eukprot:COSAG06_NODE_795_length_12228_cov_51.650507_5_plen_396_part_00